MAILRVAIDDCLRCKDSRSILLSQAGAFSYDDSLPELRKAVYQVRGRSEIDEEKDS